MNTINRLDLRLENIPADIWAKIAQIDELKGQWIAVGNKKGVDFHPPL